MPLTTEGYGGILEAASLDHEKGGKLTASWWYNTCHVLLH